MSICTCTVNPVCFTNFAFVLIGLSPDLHSMEQIRRIMRPTDVPDQGMFNFFILNLLKIILPFVKFIFYYILANISVIQFIETYISEHSKVVL